MQTSIDDGAQYDGGYVEPREGGSEWVEQATSDCYCCNKMEREWQFLTGKERTKWGKGKGLYTISTRMTRFFDKITWGYWPRKENHYALRSMGMSP